MAASAYPLDFSAPWKFSDVVLVVEGQKFHVHRVILSLWSPVFEKMFTSEFREKSENEIPLPRKKASHIREMLQMIYPSLEEKVVEKSNCYFLFELAHEYQIDSIVQKCEALMVSMVKTREEDDVLGGGHWGVLNTAKPQKKLTNTALSQKNSPNTAIPQDVQNLPKINEITKLLPCIILKLRANIFCGSFQENE